jgi:hypothetical protein
MNNTRDKIKFNPMSEDPEVRAYTQNKCLDAMHLINLFVNAYDKHRYDKTNAAQFNFVSSMDVFRKECKLYGFGDDE